MITPLISRERGFISGAAFHRLCDHTYDPARAPFDPTAVERGDTIFVRTALLEQFFNRDEEAIGEPYILVSHNSDVNLTLSYGSFLASENLFHWFAQNCVELEHKRLTPIPIGLLNPHNYKGNPRYFKALQSKISVDQRPFLVSYLGCKIRNVSDRQIAQDYFSSLEWCNFQKKQPFHSYLEMMGKSRFIVCPEGAGFDTHRIWEALYLGAYPIVKHSSMDILFEHLPVVLVSDWEEVTEEKLAEVAREFRGEIFDQSRLYMPYWANKIAQEQEKCRKF